MPPEATDANEASPALSSLVSKRMSVLVMSAGIVCILTGGASALMWDLDISDRADGDDIRWGFWHNPYMQFHPFNLEFLDATMSILKYCSLLVALGGVLLLLRQRWAIVLITWPTWAGIAIHVFIAIAIVYMTLGFGMMPWELKALCVRLGTVAFDLLLIGFLTSKAVREHFIGESLKGVRAFEVVFKDTQ